MDRNTYADRRFKYTDNNFNKKRWNMEGKEGCLIQFFSDYGQWSLVDGSPDLTDDLRWQIYEDERRPTIQFLPGDIVLYLGVEPVQRRFGVTPTTFWNYKLLWKGIIVESGPVFLPIDNYFSKSEMEVFNPGEEPWDCSELQELEIRYRIAEDTGW